MKLMLCPPSSSSLEQVHQLNIQARVHNRKAFRAVACVLGEDVTSLFQLVRQQFLQSLYMKNPQHRQDKQ